MFETPYEADFDCPAGHKFKLRVSPFSKVGDTVVCPACYQDWIFNNIPHGRQMNMPREVRNDPVPLGVKYTGGTP